MIGKCDIESIFKKNYRPLCIYAIHIVGDVDVAEDLVMDQFLKYAEHENEHSSISNPVGYLYQMTRNAALDYNRKHDIVSPHTDIPDLEDDHEAVVEMCEREARLWKVVDKLPPVRKQVLLMSKRDGMKYRDIATALGISVKTVESHMRKAFASLRMSYNHLYGLFLALVCGFVFGYGIWKITSSHNNASLKEADTKEVEIQLQRNSVDTVKIFKFNNTPVSDALNEISAYFHSNLVASDTTKHVTGEIQAGSEESVISILEQTLDIKIDRK